MVAPVVQEDVEGGAVEEGEEGKEIIGDRGGGVTIEECMGSDFQHEGNRAETPGRKSLNIRWNIWSLVCPWAS